ncbi:Uncharacterised protein [Klebsiella pneumoniae]|nr:Uncharacterised protein [Klebsiella pneumoniae]
MILKDKHFPPLVTILAFSYFTSMSTYADANSDRMAYQVEILKTREEVSSNESDYVYRTLMQRNLQQQLANRDDNTQFGLHGMEIPAVNANGDLKKIDRAYSLLAHAGVDSLRSFETAWHRVSDVSGNPTLSHSLTSNWKKQKNTTCLIYLCLAILRLNTLLPIISFLLFSLNTMINTKNILMLPSQGLKVIMLNMPN